MSQRGPDTGGQGGGVKVPAEQPLMRTEAEQLAINQTRLEAELYQLWILANQQSQQPRVAEFVGATMGQQEQRQPHATYNVFTGNGRSPPAPPAPAVAPVAVNPTRQIQALERRLQEERQQSQQKCTRPQLRASRQSTKKWQR